MSRPSSKAKTPACNHCGCRLVVGFNWQAYRMAKSHHSCDPCIALQNRKTREAKLEEYRANERERAAKHRAEHGDAWREYQREYHREYRQRPDQVAWRKAYQRSQRVEALA